MSNLLPDVKEDLEADFNETDFTRRRKLPLSLVIAILLNMVRPGKRVGYQNVIDRFFSDTELAHQKSPIQPPDKSSFIKARKKLPTEALMEIFENAVSQAGSMASEREKSTWKGFRVVAIDGTKKNLPHSKELVDNFGVPHGAHYPQMLTCALYDVFSKVPLNLAWGPYDTSERAIALELIKDLGPGDLLLLDRGYPGFELFEALIILGIDFMMRIPENGLFKVIMDFLGKGQRDGLVMIEPPRALIRERQKLGQPEPKPICLRVVKARLSKGVTGVFVTTLRDKKKYLLRDLRELYHLRWEEEEFFKLVKEELEAENFRGQNCTFIDQEMIAMYLYVVLVRLMTLQTADIYSLEPDSIAQKPAFLAVARFMDRILIATSIEACAMWYYRCLKEISWRQYKKRMGRSYPRKSKSSYGKWGRR